MEVLQCTVFSHYCWALSPVKAVTLTGSAAVAAENAAGLKGLLSKTAAAGDTNKKRGSSYDHT